VKRDAQGLTIMKKDLRNLVIPYNKLDPADLRWLDEHHPLSGSPRPSSSARPRSPSTGVIDELRFGDTRSEVVAKLRRSPIFESTVAETFMGRTGLNGVFRTKQTVGGIHCLLDFDWDHQDGLSEITLKTEPKEPTAWETSLQPCMAEFVTLITSLHGTPLVANKTVNLGTLQEGDMMANYLWNLEPRGSILLGPAKQDGHLHVAVRFTFKRHTARPDSP
jgi:hypothetical protein